MNLSADPKTRILEYIREFCQGHYRAETRAVIAKKTYLTIDHKDDQDAAERELREITAELVKEGYPILSSNEGIYYSDNPDDIERVARRILSDAAKTKERGDNLMRIAHKIRSGRTQATIYPMADEKKTEVIK